MVCPLNASGRIERAGLDVVNWGANRSPTHEAGAAVEVASYIFDGSHGRQGAGMVVYERASHRPGLSGFMRGHVVVSRLIVGLLGSVPVVHGFPFRAMGALVQCKSAPQSPAREASQ